MSEEINKYYLSVIKMAEKLGEEKKYSQALELLTEELQASYIPLEFEAKLSEVYASLNFERKNNEEGNKFKLMSREELFNNIFSNIISMVYAILEFFDRYKGDLTKNELAKFRKLLVNENINNETKIVLLEQLKLCGKTGLFNFHSLFSSKIYKINLAKQVFIKDDPLFKETVIKINELYENEPSTKDLANDIIFFVYNHYFPDFSEIKSKEEFVLALVKAISILLGNHDKWADSKLCDSILKIVREERRLF
ncbi:MAG: DUF3196 family protein [Mycoplasmoidaceae bacterium]